jgi:hypothetical protein
MQKLVCPIRLEISLFYLKNTLKMYVECVTVLCNYKQPKNIKKN